jgi:hypothetical protein
MSSTSTGKKEKWWRKQVKLLPEQIKRFLQVPDHAMYFLAGLKNWLAGPAGFLPRIKLQHES